MVSISFANPYYLIFLIALPILVVIYLADLVYIKRRAVKFAHIEALRKITEGQLSLGGYLLPILRFSILFFLIFALAGTTLHYHGRGTESDFV